MGPLMRNLFKQNDTTEDIQPDKHDTCQGIVERGAFQPPRPLLHGPSLYTDAQRARLQALQINIFKLRTQMFQASVTQRDDVAMWLSYVEMYHLEMNHIIAEACGMNK